MIKHKGLGTIAFAIVLLAGCSTTGPILTPGGSMSPSLAFVNTITSGTGGCQDPNASPRTESSAADTLTVHQGDVLRVALVESEGFMTSGLPESFAWQPPTSADPTLLAPVAACPTDGFASLPIEIGLFKAIRPGTTTVTAVLSPDWASPAPRCPMSTCGPLTPVVVTVDVVP